MCLVRRPDRARLNGLDGVEATVNYATDQAAVAFDPASSRSTTSSPGRGGRLPRRARAEHATAERRARPCAAPRRLGRADRAARARRDGGAAPVRRLGVGRASRSRPPSCSGAAGPSTAPPSARRATAPPRWTRSSRSARSQPGAGRAPSCSRALDAETYFEVGAVITTLILLGRYLEARARRRSGEAIRALLELGAKEARVLRDGTRCSSRSRSSSSATASSCGPARRSRPTASSSRACRPSTSRC